MPPELPSGLAAQQGAGPWPYDIVREAGAGASSTVWLATQTLSGAKVALKVGRSLAERTRLANEAEKLCLVDSLGLCSFLGAGVVPQSLRHQYPQLAGAPYVALQWCEGEPLNVHSVRDESARVQLALAVARDVGEAIEALHATGLAHGDIKPANVMVRVGGDALATHATLVDLGMGDALANESLVSGTPHYLPPQAAENSSANNARTRDLWAFGRVLAEILSPDLLAHKELDRDRIGAMRCPDELKSLIAALLSTHPALRPSAHWVSRTARALLQQSHSTADLATLWAGAVRRSYIATRRGELERAALCSSATIAVTGIAGDWLRQTLSQLCAIADLRRGQAERTAASAVLAIFPASNSAVGWCI